MATYQFPIHLDEETTRRTLLRRAGGAGIAAPALLAASRLLHDGNASAASPEHQISGSAAAAQALFTPYDPFLAPVQAGPKAITVVSKDATVMVAKDVTMAAWTFDGTVPGRTLRVVEGDTVDFTLTMDPAVSMGHSLDFHSAQTPPNVSYKTINPGESFSWSFTPKYPGAYMYHCGTPPALLHIGAGMYGAMIVDPKEGWPPAQELVFVQSEIYLADGENGVRVPDITKMFGNGAMDHVVFNGYANQYVEHPIDVRVGEPIRIFLVNAGPNVWSSFHVVGAIFDRACVNANPRNELFGLQSMSVGPGDGACVEFTLEEPGEYVAVNHAFGHATHGAVAVLRAT